MEQMFSVRSASLQEELETVNGCSLSRVRALANLLEPYGESLMRGVTEQPS